jgi:hypothetical protein
MMTCYYEGTSPQIIVRCAECREQLDIVFDLRAAYFRSGRYLEHHCEKKKWTPFPFRDLMRSLWQMKQITLRFFPMLWPRK